MTRIRQNFPQHVAVQYHRYHGARCYLANIFPDQEEVFQSTVSLETNFITTIIKLFTSNGNTWLYFTK